MPVFFLLLVLLVLPKLSSQGFTPVFSPKGFIVLALTFSSVIHFELIFVYGRG